MRCIQPSMSSTSAVVAVVVRIATRRGVLACAQPVCDWFSRTTARFLRAQAGVFNGLAQGAMQTCFHIWQTN